MVIWFFDLRQSSDSFEEPCYWLYSVLQLDSDIDTSLTNVTTFHFLGNEIYLCL